SGALPLFEIWNGLPTAVPPQSAFPKSTVALAKGADGRTGASGAGSARGAAAGPMPESAVGPTLESILGPTPESVIGVTIPPSSTIAASSPGNPVSVPESRPVLVPPLSLPPHAVTVIPATVDSVASRADRPPLNLTILIVLLLAAAFGDGATHPNTSTGRARFACDHARGAASARLKRTI